MLDFDNYYRVCSYNIKVILKFSILNPNKIKPIFEKNGI